MTYEADKLLEVAIFNYFSKLRFNTSQSLPLLLKLPLPLLIPFTPAVCVPIPLQKKPSAFSALPSASHPGLDFPP